MNNDKPVSKKNKSPILIKANSYEVFNLDGDLIGFFEDEEPYIFKPSSDEIQINAEELRAIADQLDKVNAL
jgi:hypothetical protein